MGIVWIEYEIRNSLKSIAHQNWKFSRVIETFIKKSYEIYNFLLIFRIFNNLLKDNENRIKSAVAQWVRHQTANHAAWGEIPN